MPLAAGGVIGVSRWAALRIDTRRSTCQAHQASAGLLWVDNLDPEHTESELLEGYGPNSRERGSPHRLAGWGKVFPHQVAEAQPTASNLTASFGLIGRWGRHVCRDQRIALKGISKDHLKRCTLGRTHSGEALGKRYSCGQDLRKLHARSALAKLPQCIEALVARQLARKAKLTHEELFQLGKLRSEVGPTKDLLRARPRGVGGDEDEGDATLS
mmetsp:Transcript_91588/g.264150  ORF Transcript_91588/g.264150 Transcript_91588/m.264150 type:complete len:214 (-) Transcript_91588:3-644(-)